jgi:voltage-gated potassium channel
MSSPVTIARHRGRGSPGCGEDSDPGAVQAGVVNASRRAGYDALSPARRRRLIVRSLGRSALAATVLVVLYYVVPMDRSVDVATGIGLAAGLLAVAGVVSVQVWQITHSDYPRLKAVETLATSIPLLLLTFATTYYLLAHGEPASFTQALTRTDALYFTVTVFSTVGFGDIAPSTETTRVVTMIQMLADLVVFGLIAQVILGAVKTGLRRQSARQNPPPGAGGENV